jgi:tetratricopeptide (TPR) repeat protein
MLRLLFIIPAVLTSALFAQKKTPTAYEIHQRFQREANFSFRKNLNSNLDFRPSEDFPEEVVPADSAGQSVLNNWPDKIVYSREMEEIKDLMREGKGREAITRMQIQIKKHPGVTPFQYYLAEAYVLEWEHDKAERILDSLIAAYPLYSFPYRLRAEIFARKKQFEEALKWAAKARILQAAHPKIIGTFESVASRGGYKMELKLIRPNYIIIRELGKFIVEADGLWETFGKCRCLWDHSELYAMERGGDKGIRYNMQREQECLLAMLSQVKINPELQKLPEVRLLERAVQTGTLQEFVMVELFLPLQPALAFSFSDEQKRLLESYLINVRVKSS